MDRSMTRSVHDRLTDAYAARFGPEPEPEQSGWSILGDWLANIAIAILCITGWLWIIGAPISWGIDRFFN